MQGQLQARGVACDMAMARHGMPRSGRAVEHPPGEREGCTVLVTCCEVDWMACHDLANLHGLASLKTTSPLFSSPLPCISSPCRKDIHPEWHPEAKVICNGVEVMTVGGVKPSYNVDIYSGNHPFYQGAGTSMVMDEGQVRLHAHHGRERCVRTQSWKRQGGISLLLHTSWVGALSCSSAGCAALARSFCPPLPDQPSSPLLPLMMLPRTAEQVQEALLRR